MLYIIGLGLDEKSVSLEGLEAVKKCKKIYLENYTVEFSYSKTKIEKIIGKKIQEADREKVESCELVCEAKKQDIALLVYGSPLTATTHITLIQEAKKKKVEYKIIYSASVFDAIAECGLQLYKFGKIASIPNFEADSFIETIKDNQKINAHSLILIDIGLGFKDAINKLERTAEKNKIKLSKLIVCSRLGTNESSILGGSISNLRKEKISAPFCFIIPGKLHFIEEEFLKNFNFRK